MELAFQRNNPFVKTPSDEGETTILLNGGQVENLEFRDLHLGESNRVTRIPRKIKRNREYA